MVKKLWKHEYLAWLRVLPLIYGIALVVAAMLRILMVFENESTYYDIVLVFAILMLAVALMVTVAAPIVFGIMRFYKNMFTGEGYLTHVLPVTPAAHLRVKLLTAASFQLISLVVCLLAGVIATSGELLSEIWKAAAYLLNKIPENMIGHCIGWTAEILLLMVVGTATTFAMYYLCICLGQLARKNRVLAAVGVYFGFYVVNQILSTVMTVVFAILGETGELDRIVTVIKEHPLTTAHGFVLLMVVLSGVLCLVYYLICHRILRKKLNLE